MALLWCRIWCILIHFFHLVALPLSPMEFTLEFASFALHCSVMYCLVFHRHVSQIVALYCVVRFALDYFVCISLDRTGMLCIDRLLRCVRYIALHKFALIYVTLLCATLQC